MIWIRSAVLLLSVSTLHAREPTPTPQEEGGGEPYRPEVHAASDEGALALQRFELAEGLAVELWAAEPLLANPVCIAIDFLGRVYVAETFRLHAGVTDMRSHREWLDEDLASRTVAERLAMMARHEGDLTAGYGTEHERVRRLVDTDGDGTADEAKIFADGFKDPAAGIAAGLLPRGDTVYYACIPDLWKLVDADQDGVAEERTSLASGFGVNIALLGHDLHGLRMGPDGMLYFSIGDRGFHVETEGRTLAHAHCGAVLRCEPDGSGLEVFATGLRNPQELVFDEHGNLFTGDNNSDGGDRARWVFVLEGGDSGWRYSYQWITEPNLRGPWNAEKQWHPPHEGQPAFLNPPIANFADGPSGLTYYPGGETWSWDWEGTFFLCDFRGAPGPSGVWSFKNAAKGAGFELVDAKKLLWRSLATDADFGPDGALYVSDWVDGWGMTGKGRIYRVAPEGHADNWRAQDVARLLGEGMRERGETELGTLLAHDHKDVRLEAQLELVQRAREGRGDAARNMLSASAQNTGHPTLKRLHAVWGLGQLARQEPGRRDVLRVLHPMLREADHEVRAQVVKTLGQARYSEALGELISALGDPSPRVRLYAAEALGRIGARGAAGPLFALLETNADADPWLRHAACWALVSIGDRDAVVARTAHPSVAVRRAACVVLRRWEDPRVAAFLSDPEPSVRAEAARAIHDVPIVDGALEALAASLEGEAPVDDYHGRRMLNANRLVGGAPAAARIARWLAEDESSSMLRTEALEILTEWTEPAPRDRVVGAWRPVPERSSEELAGVVAGLELAATGGLDARQGAFARWGDDEHLAWARLVRRVGGSPLHSVEMLLTREDVGWRVRREALETVLAVPEGETPRAELLERAAGDPDGRVRARAFEELAKSQPERALALLKEAVLEGETEVRQESVRTLAGIDAPGATEFLVELLGRSGVDPDLAPLELDLVEACEARGAELAVEAYRARVVALEPDYALWGGTLVGGDWKAGRKTFREKAEVACLRCHAVGDDGASEVGPNLGGVGLARTRAELRESIVHPNRVLGEGYENWILSTDDGLLVVGRIASEDAETVRVLTYENGEVGEVLLSPSEVVSRKKDVSAMPGDLVAQLSPREMRDLIEFLATRKDPEYALDPGPR